MSSPDRNRRDTARAAQQQEETLRARWEETQERLLTRFEEPISFATRVTKRTLAWFPVRVWRHFLIANGFLLAAGVSYQALFAIFAAVYVAFALAGLWLGGSEQAIQNLIDLINQYVPGLIDKDGPITPDAVAEIATNSASLFGITGAIALVTLIWTAIGWVTFSRRAVREIFVLPPDRRPYLLLKSGDLLAAALFGILLLIGGGLGAVGTWALDIVFSLFGLDTGSVWFSIGVRTATLLISFAINAAALAALYRFLTGTSLRWRTIWPGALLAGAAVTVLQLGAGWLLSYTPTNALLATFAIFVGLLAGLAFGVPLMAYAASIQDDKGQFALVQRFLFVPMFLFSGTFYPLESLPIWLQWIGWISPLWHASELGRMATYGAPGGPGAAAVHLTYLLVLTVVGYAFARRTFTQRLAK